MTKDFNEEIGICIWLHRSNIFDEEIIMFLSLHLSRILIHDILMDKGVFAFRCTDPRYMTNKYGKGMSICISLQRSRIYDQSIMMKK